jgi:PAS domain S-box-containing protein
VRPSRIPDQPQDEALDRLTRLQTLTASLSEAVTSEQVADAILSQTVAVLGAISGVIYRLGEDGSEFVCLRMTGYPDDVAAAWGRFPAALRTPISDAVRLTRPVVVPTLAELRTRYPDAAQFPTLQGEASAIALPLVIWGKSIGGIGLRFSSDRTFPERDRSFLLTVAGLCAQALERARLYDLERAARDRAEREAEERRRVNEALRESEARFRSVVQCNMIGVGFWEADGRFVDPNDALLRMTGYSREDFDAGRVRRPDLTPPKYWPRDEHALAETRATGACTPYEKEFVRKDGSRIPVLIGGGCLEGCPDRGAFFALDISAQKQAEREARRSEQFYRLLADAVPGMTWSANTVDGLDYLSPRWEEYTGLTLEAIRATGWQAANHPDELAAIVERFAAAARTGQPFEMEFRYRRHDGQYRWFLGRQIPVPDPDGRGLRWVGTLIDIDDRKRAEDDLRESEERLRTLSNNLAHGAVYQILAEPGGRRRFVYISAGVERLLGVTPAEVLADPDVLYGLVHEDDRPHLAEREEAARRALAPFDCEFRSYTRSGDVRWLHAHSAPHLLPGGETAWDGIIIDMTEWRHAERESRLSRERLDLVVNSVDLGLWYCDLPFDKLVWNARVKEHFGLPPDHEVTIETFYERLHPDDRERTRRAIERSIDEHSPYDIEYRTVGLDARERWVRAIGRPFYDPSGRPSRFDGVTVDVTERVRQAEALKEADRRKDEFLAMLAHELRNPLAPIRNAVEVFRLLGPADPDLEWARDMIGRQVQQLTRLVDDLLDVSRITRGKIALRKEPVDLAAVVARAVETSRPLLDARGHELTLDLPREPLRVEADATRLAQVVSNLLNNAARYTEEGGHIRLSVEPGRGEAVVRVRDDGMGIPAELLPQVFELFTQGDRSLARSEGGLGIGLTLVKRLVELHGGRVEARSAGPGRGSEFIVRLRTLAPQPKRDMEDGGRGPSEVPPRPRRVLVVDDNEDAAESLALLLRARGHEIRTAHDGPSALSVAEDFRPEVVFLDIGLPRMDGYEVARRLRVQPGREGLLLVALTGYGQDEDRRRAEEAGFDAHLVKPADLEALQRLLNAGAEWR